MTSAVPTLVWVVVALPLVGVLLSLLARSSRYVDLLAQGVAFLTAVVALILAGIAFSRGGQPALHGHWYLVDGGSGLLLAVTGIVGFCSTFVSPAYLRHLEDDDPNRKVRSRGLYYAGLFVFWAALLAIPVCGNLAITWLIVESTTASSALLVGFTGRSRALEAGWKYLVLSTLGLSVALLGIGVLAIQQANAGHLSISALDWHTLRLAAPTLAKGPALIAFVLLLGGFAAKTGWAPVHNWLPDAHSEAPPPVSALLSAVLLPTVMLVVWRVKQILEPVVGVATTRDVFLGFGLLSLLIAVPFLWRSMPWKRLLAYSSMEHMGIIAIGVGFGTKLAIAGVVLHVAGHALAKALGFYASTPLLRIDPDAATRAPTGVASASPTTATAMGISVAALAGMPPSPLFVSELLIVAGGVAAGQVVVSAIAVVALALGFLGLLHALVQGVIGERASHARFLGEHGQRQTVVLTASFSAGLLAVLAIATVLVNSGFIATLTKGAL